MKERLCDKWWFSNPEVGSAARRLWHFFNQRLWAVARQSQLPAPGCQLAGTRQQQATSSKQELKSLLAAVFFGFSLVVGRLLLLLLGTCYLILVTSLNE
jgi:hypothetical protein